MAKIERQINHSLGLDGAKTAVAALAGKLQEHFASLIKEVKWNDDKTAASVKGTGFDGNFTVSATDIKLVMNLGLLATPFKGKIEEEIDKHTTPEEIENFAKSINA